MMSQITRKVQPQRATDLATKDTKVTKNGEKDVTTNGLTFRNRRRWDIPFWSHGRGQFTEPGNAGRIMRPDRSPKTTSDQ